MTKYEFERVLKRGIKSLPAAEGKKALDYYNEIFEDKIERGMSESAIIAEFGDPAEIADKLVSEFGSEDRSSVKAEKVAPVKPQMESHIGGGRLVVFIILAIIFGGALVGIAAGIWACVLGLLAGGGACVLAGVVAIIPSIIEQLANPAVMWVQLGICVAAVGIGILLIVLSIKIAKLCWFLTKKMFGMFKSWLLVKHPVAQ